MAGWERRRPGDGGPGGQGRRPAGARARRPWATHVVAATAIIAFAALVGLFARWLFPPVGWVENRVADIRVATLSPSEPQHPEIVVVAVTENTLATLPYRSPLDRRFLAGLLRALEAAGVRAIGFDILLDQPTEAAKDAELRGVLKALRVPVVVAWAESGDKLTERQTAFLEDYLEGLEKGLPNLETDPGDGTVRWIFPGRRRADGMVPGLAAALAAVLGAPVPGTRIALAYRKGPDARTPAFRVFPAHTLRFLPKAWLAGKIVVIGSDLPHSDRHRTPFAAVYGEDRGALSGALIHAHALAQLLDGRRVPGMGRAGEGALAVALAILGLLLVALDMPVPAKIGAGVGGLAVLWVGGFALFDFAGALIPLVTPSLAFAVSGGIGSAYLGRRDRQQKRFIRQAFSRFTSPAVVDLLIADPSRLTLGGERREITCLFTDLAGFTALIEKSEPADVLPLFNRYLDGMCRIVFDHDGTIDKIVGDALVVFFGAPLEQPDHTARAMACALALDAFAQAFAAERKTAGIEFGETRIGLNTGMAVLGNFGGEAFFDYTAHGDTMNTAARMESVNKHLGTRVCVTGATASRCPGMHFRPVGVLVLKGKRQGVEAFEPLSPEAAASPATAAYVKAFELMRTGDAGAGAAFASLLKDHPDDRLAAFHAARLAAGEVGATIVLREK